MKDKLVLPCLRGLIGDWIFYSTLMSAKQISEWVMPVKNIREAKTLDQELQRSLKERKKAIARYLLTDNNRFFNSIIVGVFGELPDWFEFDLKKAQGIIPSNQQENIKHSVGLMVFNNSEKMFAIDGQHRVAGIEIAVREDKNEILIDDQFSVIFVAHIDDADGMKRTRKLFSDINKNAKPVSGGDKIIIDEENLSAMVARRIYAEYPYFKNGKLISLTELSSLDKDDIEHFTNLLNLYNINKILKRLFRKTPKTQDWDEINVTNFKKVVIEFYDYIFKNITEYSEFFVTKKIDLKKARDNNMYMLFRPVGLKLVAQLYVYFKLKYPDLEKFKANINKINFVFPESPFNLILWNNGKMESKEANQKIAFDLSLYLLNEMSEEQTDELLQKYRDALKNPVANLPNKLV